VTPAQTDISFILRRQGGLISRRSHPELAGAIDGLLRRGDLVSVLPGVYAAPDVADAPITRARASQLWEPDSVLTHHSAAQLTFWPAIRVTQVHCAAPSRRARRAGFVISRRHIPADLVVECRGLRCTAPALTALDLTDLLGGEAIDVLLRSRHATLDHLHDAWRATSRRPGNARRGQFVLDSRDNPWSPPERKAHALLRAAGITGWKGNFPVHVCGHMYYIDIAFPEVRLAIEIDGREFHADAIAFEKDRWRQNDLINAGWRVLRFTARMIEEAPELVIAVILDALAG